MGSKHELHVVLNINDPEIYSKLVIYKFWMITPLCLIQGRVIPRPYLCMDCDNM